MKNASTLNSQGKIDSPKTPGGIRKSLLTPCRRLGLSRNWRKNGPSPFISPLAGSSEIKVEKSEPRKRKKRDEDEEQPSESPHTPVLKDTNTEDPDLIGVTATKIEGIATTPSRNVTIPRRKKSKTLLSARIVDKGSHELESPKPPTQIIDTATVEYNARSNEAISNNHTEDFKENTKNVTIPVRTKSKSKTSQNKTATKEEQKCVELKECISHTEKTNSDPVPANNVTLKPKSPENLTKECIVVIQKKIFKKDVKSIEEGKAVKDKKTVISQSVCDSDSDDVPLIALNKEEIKQDMNPVIVLDDDGDFDDTHKVKVKKLVDKTTSIGGLKADSMKKKGKEKIKTLPQKVRVKTVETKLHNVSKPSSQSSDDDDFIIDNRKTILIRKSYDKVIQPCKAKSTGSITQKDIDELKSRIEMKKKLLLAKAVSEDTEELRDLIKKWQKGCQDALMELMELMKSKFPDKQNMDYSEILQTLKIPSSLVGYDEDNDCFNTPTDESIILSKFN